MLYLRSVLLSTRLKNAILVSIPLMFSMLLILYIVSQKYDLSKLYDFLLTTSAISICSIFYFNQLLTKQVELDVSTNPNFFIVGGILMFHSCSFLVMGLVNYIYKQDPILAKQVYSINHILNIIYYSLIAYGFYIQWKSTKSSLSS